MAIPKEFYEALKNDDVSSIRVHMTNSLLLDHSFNDFRTMQQEAKNVPNLYQPFDNRELIEDRSTWTKDVLDRQLAKLMMNFCPERIEYVQQMIEYLYPATGQKPGESASDNSKSASSAHDTRGAASSGQSSYDYGNAPYHEQKKRDQEKGAISKVVYCGAGGAVVGGIIGAMSGSAAIGVGLGAAAGVVAGLVLKEVGHK